MKYRIGRRAAWRTVGDETIVLDLETKRMYGLNESAAFLWQTISTMEDFDSMLQAMTRAESPSFGAEILAAFCDELVELGLMEEGRSEQPVSVVIDPPADLEPPRILWQETLERVAASCAFLPGQNSLCNQVPVS